ncbi:hypothetical protein HZR84_13280 [Hyphobacterium sp. CCMP332]|nr:hypothetical protein HZR84_13280 [Hyphobacterium sp. CCMP332]
MNNYDSNSSYLLILLLTVFISGSCKSGKSASQADNQFQAGFKFIDFGYGGGFAGTYNYYRLMENANLWKLENNHPTSRINRIPLDDIISIDVLSKDLINSDFQSNMRGNMTYFLTIRIDTTDFEYIWKEEADPVAHKASVLFDKLDEVRKNSLKN